VNAGTETRAGVNLTVRSSPWRSLTLDGSYSYLHRTVDAAGAFPVGTPVHKGVASATARLPRAMTGMATINYQSGALGMSDNGLPLPPNALTRIDLGVMVPIGAGFSVQTGVRNALDRNYYYWEGFPEAGRTGYVTLRYTF
jgi:iron complex outermembrane receptor protein